MTRMLCAAFAALVLAACGGGGDTPPNPPPPGSGTTDVVAAAGTLQVTAGTATYESNTLEADAYAAINEARAAAGAGYVSQSAALDTAATAHAGSRGRRSMSSRHPKRFASPWLP
jgi:uncharacterized protein YkwD